MMPGLWPRFGLRANQTLQGNIIINTAIRLNNGTKSNLRTASTSNVDAIKERYANKIKSRIGVDVDKIKDPTDYYRQKYADKLRAKAESLGTTVDELEAKVKQERKEQMKKKQLEISVEKERGQLPLAKQQPNGIKSLDQIMHLDLIKDKDPETISQIWNQHYANRQGLSAVLPLESYQRLKERSLKYPSFILPLPRDEGAEIFWIQFSGSQCYITSLAEYKLRVEQARPYVILTHYDDLANEKGIVLMRGELCEDDKGKLLMEANDAQLLVYQIQQFYVTGGEEKQRLLETFHERPNEFSLDQLLNEANRLS